MRRLRPLVLGLVLLAAGPSLAAPPALPERMTYQGALFDDQGAPRVGPVDLTVRIFDAPAGGMRLYVQHFDDVPLADGVFTVALGPTGAATDTPGDPLTTSLAEALAGDLPGVGAGRYLELTVGGAGPLARAPVLSVGYALRAAVAETADVATTAQDVETVAGLPAIVVQQLFEHANLDDSGPPNGDPREGFADVDGDGLPNYLDPDNDNDGLSDSTELGASQNSDINLVTPVLTSSDPTSGLPFGVTTITLAGSSFDPSMEVRLGSAPAAPYDVTPTSAKIDVGFVTEAPAAALPIEVVLANGESDVRTGAFSFRPASSHGVATAVPTQLSFDVLGTGRMVLAGKQEYAIDATAAGLTGLGTELAFPPLAGNSDTNLPGQIAVGFDPTSRLVGVRCVAGVGQRCSMRHYRDADGDWNLADETGVEIELIGDGSFTINRTWATSLAFDPSGRLAVGYVAFENSAVQRVMVAHDRDGDGLFTGPNERVQVEAASLSGVETNLAELAVSPGGQVAIAYFDGAQVRLAHDRSGDGDFDDNVGGTPEIVTVAATAAASCLGLGFSPGGEPVVVFGDGAAAPTVARDLDGSGDFAGPAEIAALPAGSGAACDASGGPLAAVAALPFLYVDRNDDGDFDDADEMVDLAVAGSPEHAEIAFNVDGRVFVATDAAVYFDPIP